MAFSKNINLLGISTVSGNQLIDNMTKNTLKILNSIGFISESVVNKSDYKEELKFEDCISHGGLKVPVIEGCGIPFLGKPVTASNIHGNTGLEGINKLLIKEYM
jgi:inosine-uridine nucleoside N-ribohydrolase